MATFSKGLAVGLSLGNLEVNWNVGLMLTNTWRAAMDDFKRSDEGNKRCALDDENAAKKV